jgi:hypothetical protein
MCRSVNALGDISSWRCRPGEGAAMAGRCSVRNDNTVTFKFKFRRGCPEIAQLPLCGTCLSCQVRCRAKLFAIGAKPFCRLRHVLQIPAVTSIGERGVNAPALAEDILGRKSNRWLAPEYGRVDSSLCNLSMWFLKDYQHRTTTRPIRRPIRHCRGGYP